MDFETDEELAMVLPIPVKAGVVEADVKFVNLHAYLEFFGGIVRESGRRFAPSRSFL